MMMAMRTIMTGIVRPLALYGTFSSLDFFECFAHGYYFMVNKKLKSVFGGHIFGRSIPSE